ncbi:MAG: hypothetical protein KGK10_13905 [Rhodospirillales bacterium]|nr:hypothetical protein [Rhodospirillales bacterium]
MSPAFTRRALLGAGSALALASAALASPALASPATPQTLTFELHATFFSHEVHLARPLDPQVFVADRAAKAAVGPQLIKHADGVRPAFIAGPTDVGALNAQGKPLGFTVADWFAARGTATIVPDGAGMRVTCHFTHLRPNGVYSLFENHFDQKPIGFTPLDGAGTANNFVADANGAATVTVRTPGRMTHANGILLVYHSDNQSHGTLRGAPGVTAHHQLIVRIPG